MIWNRSVNVHQVPEHAIDGYDPEFSRFKEQCSEMHRPKFVLDCSRIWDLNIDSIKLLLSYLEEVMRYNGDVRLAALRPEAKLALREAGVIHLFELYATTEMAVQSFQHRATSMVPLAYQEVVNESAEYAA